MLLFAFVKHFEKEDLLITFSELEGDYKYSFAIQNSEEEQLINSNRNFIQKEEMIHFIS